MSCVYCLQPHCCCLLVLLTAASSRSFTTLYYMYHTHTHPFNGLFSGTTRLSQYQKGKTNLDFTEARDSGISWAISVCTSLQTDNHASTPPLSFLQAGCPSCRPTNSFKALKEFILYVPVYLDLPSVL